MSESAKTAVLHYLEQTAGTSIRNRSMTLDTHEEGTVCHVSIELGGHHYSGYGVTGKKRDAERIAYEDVLCELVLAGHHEINNCELLLEEAASEKAQRALDECQRLKQSLEYVPPHVRAAIDPLRHAISDKHIPPKVSLTIFRQRCRLDQCEQYLSTPVYGRAKTSWYTQASISLHNGVQVTSSSMFHSSKAKSQEAAARDLMKQILIYYSGK
jgi:hypothetical protein